MNEDLIQAGINYYARNKYWRHVQEVVKFGLKRLGNDPVMHFWNGFALLMEGRTPEATRELTTIVDQRDVTLCASLALIQAHKAAKVADKEAIAQFEERVKNEVKNCGEIALQQAALFMFVTGRHDKARDLVDKLIKMNANNADALALRGWIDLTCGRDANSKKSLKFFDDAIKLQSEGKLHADALFGKIAYLQKQKSEFQKSLELINTAVVQFPSFLPALIEKSKALVSVGDWEQATETAGRCLNADAKCVEAMRVLLLHKLCRTGNYTEASKKLGEIIQALDSTEPNSHRLYFDISQSAARLSGRHRLVLQQTTTLLERAIGMNKDSPDYLVEQGYQLLLADSEKEALKAYRQAMQIDQSSVTAINGVILCQLLDGQIEEAAQQLEFLNEIQSSIGKNAEHSYLGALLAAKKNDSSERVLSLLDEAVKCQLEKVQGQCVGEELFINMSPDFMLQMAKLYMQYAPTEAPERGEAEPPVLQKCARLLESLTKIAPGLLEAVYLLAKTKFLSGNTEQALSGAQYCLKQDSTFSDAHLLMAQIQLASGNAKAASTSLEVGLSFNFEVREAPLYHIISAKICQVDGKLDEAMKALQTAMKLPGIRKAAAVVQGAKKKTKKPVVLGDRVSVYLETAKVFWLMNQQHEATKVIQDALTEFQGTPEEIRIIIANAEFAVSRGDIDGALSALRDIKPTQTYFVQAREKMAEIYLKHRKDKRLYAACYRELVDLNPSSHAHLLLGDAYMNIQEPEKAIAVYESALKKNPRDGMLASKIGSALVKTHDYNKAINYYEAAVKSGEQSQLRADLAELYIKLKQYDKAEKVITSALESENNGDLAAAVAEVRYNMLLARMQNSAGKAMMAIQTLARARETQAKVINRVAAEQPEILKQQQQLAADICFQMAEHHDKVGKDAQKAIINYQDALQYDETNIKALLALSKLYLARGDLEAAQFQLATLLRIDKVNNDGTVMMADLMFRKQEYDSATFHFQQLLERDPEHYEALARLVDLLRRAGKLALCPKFLDQAEKASARSQTEPGFNYCKGLYKRYTNCPIEALKHFNYARKDSDWGIKAIYNMIEICINPEDDTIGGETFQSSTNANEAANLKTADRLLQELQDLGEDRTEQFQAMRAYALMASKQKVNIEKALNEFIALAKGKEDNAVALLGMSRAYMLLKQSPKARSQLKLITKLEWTPQEAETFEAAWLLFADLYIDTGKYDLAQELLKKVLQHNKSCSRAWEYMGFIMEKEQSYANAAEFYENAWSFCNESNATVGYKLAFNYLKAKRCVDAIDICHAVLKKDPQFPKIRKEVLDKARQGVRV